MLLVNYAKRLKRLQQFLEEGWSLYDVDLVGQCYYFSKDYRVLKVKMSEKEKAFFKILDDLYVADPFLRDLTFKLVEKLFEDLFVHNE